MKITKNEFGMTKDNQPISLYTIENASGASVTLSDYGCRIIKIMVPNKEGKLTDVILGLMNADEYLADDASLGAVVGRCANRIAKGHFTLNDKEYNLAINNGPNHLHGGPTGFAQRVWAGKVTDDKVTFTRISPDGEEGYPGNLTVSVTYGWSEDNELSIVYEASCDQDTVFSVTSHGYFNLNGEGNGTVLDQELRIDADAITELDDTQCPTGAFLSVEGSPFDFREMKKIGDGIHCDNAQLKLGGTYDHNFVINGDGLREAAVLQSNESGIRLTCFTDQPGVQLYVPCYTLHQKGIDGKDYPPYSAVCLETQHYPNAINIEHFPSVVLKAGENFRSKTLYHFSVMG